MKLRNKKTGIIGELHFEPDKEYHFMVETEDPADIMIYKKLADLYADWEDCEEPKGIQCIYYVDHFDAAKLDGVIVGFDSKEEAEQAVEKLKAWKRLKDEYDFKFTSWKRDEEFRGDFIIKARDWHTSDDKLLDLLFGGEE